MLTIAARSDLFALDYEDLVLEAYVAPPHIAAPVAV